MNLIIHLEINLLWIIITVIVIVVDQMGIKMY